MKVTINGDVFTLTGTENEMRMVAGLVLAATGRMVGVPGGEDGILTLLLAQPGSLETLSNVLECVGSMSQMAVERKEGACA